ncbi:malectin domain-containing carbohydrate-binding protein [Persicobacter psychrovividus]|uniref:Malectin domain-containing protein n=1 Tax=Persicobacter psychrovividus TaxID=387638 RepID=A0ABN6LD92_9BACT|nr:hypothetical protein PEPS_31860 [Persicobacter psychrovividus]
MRKNLLTKKLWAIVYLLLLTTSAWAQNVSFNKSNLKNLNISSPTSLKFGPDGKLYVAEVSGKIKVLTINRNGTNSYTVTNEQVINSVQSITNHNDDGTSIGSSARLVTGITVSGSAANPEVYVTSSDIRFGAGNAGDVNLDTNSGIISRLTKNGNGSWNKVDIVRGLPRSEENHSTNNLEVVNMNGKPYLLVCSGGNTNAGAPSPNFAYITEYALAAAILSVDLNQINAMPIKGSGNNQYIYDIPTLDDPTRNNANGINSPTAPGYNGIDVGDPFGGNDGLNQAKVVAGGPVQVFAPGFRNTFDLVLTESGRLYATDNGANGGWGGYPKNEGPQGNATNEFQPSQPGFVNNKDHLHLITGVGSGKTLQNYVPGTFYGGHPCPVRANPTGAGLYTHDSENGGNNGVAGGVFRNKWEGLSKKNTTLPFDWPPVPANMANPIEGDYKNPTDDGAVTILENNTNPVEEYTASNFGGKMKGKLLAGRNQGGTLHEITLNANGSVNKVESNKYSVDGYPLGIECLSDNEKFPGTIWVATFGSSIVILEPSDYGGTNNNDECVAQNDASFNPNADYDKDGFTNQDEIDNGKDYCSGASTPLDFDGDKISDLNDPDDDNDGIPDFQDPFQMGQPFDLPVTNELFSGNQQLGGFLGLGLTGLMTNNDPNDDYLNWQDKPNASNSDIDDILGGAIGATTMYQTTGDAVYNNQEKAYQYGLKVTASTPKFLVHASAIEPLFDHKNSESQGIFIGTGDQDNYLKLVKKAGGFQVLVENNGQIAFQQFYASGKGNSNMDFMFEVDPATAKIVVKYKFDNEAENILTTYTAVGNLKTALQSSAKPVAIGFIGTSFGSGQEFPATFDFLNATYLDGTPPPAPEGNVLYRVNAGGGQINAIDGGKAWSADTKTAKSTYLSNAGSNSTASFSGTSLHSSVDASKVPAGIFNTERWDAAGGSAMKYSFPVSNGEYQVALYLGNNYSGTDNVGDRVYSVKAEGNTVISNFDPVASFGHKKGGVKLLTINVSDGALDLEFIHNQENPLVNGIEVLGAGTVTENTYYQDSDQDGYGNPSVSQSAALAPQGYVANSDDCDDTNKNVNPLATEVADGIDNNCNGQIDEGLTATGAIYRVNAGGPTVAAKDGGISWFADTKANPSAYLSSAGSNGVYAGKITSLHSSVNSAKVPTSIFTNERWDMAGGAPMEYTFPVSNGSYVVNLYMGTKYSGTNDPGERVFDIIINGQVVSNNFDLIPAFGFGNGGAVSYTVNVTNGNIKIAFGHEVENPLICGIEILGDDDGQQTTSTYYLDADGDGFGTDDNTIQSSTTPAGYSINGGDCDDGDNSIYPNAPEIFDGLDNNCNGQVDEGTNNGGGSNILYRVNAGGPAVNAIDGGPNWAADTKGAPYTFMNSSGSNSTYFGNISSLHPSVDANRVPAAIFKHERWDAAGGNEITYNFPVQNGTYTVVFYLGNAYGGTKNAGDRIFDIEAEGVTVVNDLDLITSFGHQKGGKKVAVVNVNDGNLNIKLEHVTENPLINGIEVIAGAQNLRTFAEEEALNQPPLQVISNTQGFAEKLQFFKAGTAKIVNTSGQQLIAFPSAEGQQYELNRLNSGVYIVYWFSNGQHYSRKFIIR